MNKNMKWRFAMMPFALAALAVIPLQGCDEVTNAQQSLCCSEFTPGADLVAVQWGLEGDAELNYGVFMQSVSDFTGVANAMVTDVANACQAIAVDLGSAPDEVTDTTPEGRAKAWCDLAIGKIGSASASLKVTFQPPVCTVDASVQASCEGRCNVDASCKLTPAEIVARCDPGKLSVKCEGDCTAKCEGSANLAVSCEGKCEGTCEGMCNGACSSMSGAECRGACDGECQGQCRGSCTMAAGAKVSCEGQCTGGCEGDFKAPKCTAELKANPKVECNAKADCNASCSASASAKAECREPSLVIEGDSNIDEIVATLRANLPKLIVVARARGELLKASAEVVVGASGNIEVGGSVKATACLIPAAAAIAQAASNIEASLTASVKVMGAVNIGQ